VSSPAKPKSRIAFAVGLFFLAPLIAEFLLGNLSIKMLPALVVLAPMYGGGALLIREIVRRARRGWPSIVILGMAYAIVEEAFTTQSLFNPNYLSLNLHLLQPAYIPALGIGAWWTIFVLTLHTAWSISTSIALMEALAPAAANTPWLGRTGLGVTALLFIVGAIMSTLIGYRQDHYLAAPAQLASAALACVLLIVIAFRIPRAGATSHASVPSPWLLGAFTLLAGSGVLLVPNQWDWWAALSVLGLDLLVLATVLFWSRSSLWNMRHKLALASGAALAYAWHAFIENPAVGHTNSSVRIGNAIFALGAIALIATAAAKNLNSFTGVERS
jgi:hypothetical protein